MRAEKKTRNSSCCFFLSTAGLYSYLALKPAITTTSTLTITRMPNFIRQLLSSPKPPNSRDQQSESLEPDPQDRHKNSERPKSSRGWRLRLPGSSSARGNSPIPTSRLPTPTPPAVPSPGVPVQPAQVPGVLPIERIWQRSIDLTQERLKEKKLPPLEPSSPTFKSVASVTSPVEDLKRSIDQGGKGPGADQWRKILKTIDSYAKLVDTAIQHSPAITALVWAGVRTILQVSWDSIF